MGVSPTALPEWGRGVRRGRAEQRICQAGLSRTFIACFTVSTILFCIQVGEPDPASLTEQELLALRDEGIVEMLGYRQDIAALYAQSHIVCLPSYR